jgi:hypothetical protein
VLGVLSVVNVFGSNGPSIVEKAQAALATPGNLILHFKTSATQNNKDGTVDTFSDEYWQLSSAPYTWRRIEILGNAPAVENGYGAGGLAQIYDPSTSTVYEGKDPSVPADVVGGPGFGGFKKDALKLLSAAGTKVESHVKVDGRDAIRIISGDGMQTYTVDAKTDEPLIWQAKDKYAEVTLYITYEKLAGTPENATLVDLTKQHPGATIDTDQTDYENALSKAFSKG